MKSDLAVFKAFADETRLRILFLLSRRELCVCEIVAVLDMPQGKVSRHLSVLRQAGLVLDRRDGLWVHYTLASPTSALVSGLFAYLQDERDARRRAAEDDRRLRELATRGEICAGSPQTRPERNAALNRDATVRV